MKRSRLACLVLLSALWCATVCASQWPQVDLPTGSKVEQAGEVLKLNGMPMQISKFSTGLSYEKTVDFFRNAFGRNRVENIVSGDLLIGQRQGDHFVTVRIHSMEKGAAGIVAISDIREAAEGRSRPYGLTLPSGSSVISDMESIDAGKKSRQLLITNHLSLDANRQHFIRVLGTRNLTPSRSESEDGKRLVWLEGRGHEAMLVITKDKKSSHVLLTMVGGE